MSSPAPEPPSPPSASGASPSAWDTILEVNRASKAIGPAGARFFAACIAWERGLADPSASSAPLSEARAEIAGVGDGDAALRSEAAGSRPAGGTTASDNGAHVSISGARAGDGGIGEGIVSVSHKPSVAAENARPDSTAAWGA
ncbi:MAG TPA: hypothetical protein VML19_32385 [Verrucomicrobiae bacterium]|nr:hypothetical protein [Verrucomicrobiae bacterium]